MNKLDWLRHAAMLMLADDDDSGGSSESPEDDATATDGDADEGSSADGTGEATDGGGDGGDDKFDPERALAKITKLNSENRNLREREKKAREDATKAGDSKARVTELEAENRRLKFGSKHGLPDEVTAVLRGETDEEMLSHAERLLKAFATSAPRNPDLGSQRGGGSDPTRDDDVDPSTIADAIPRL